MYWLVVIICYHSIFFLFLITINKLNDINKPINSIPGNEFEDDDVGSVENESEVVEFVFVVDVVDVVDDEDMESEEVVEVS